MEVICQSSKLLYSAYHLVRAYWPDRAVSSQVAQEQACAVLVRGEELPGDGHTLQADGIRELYLALRDAAGRELPWGMLTGVRPVKLASAWLADHPNAGAGEQTCTNGQPCTNEQYNAGLEDFVKWFRQERFVSREKAELAYRIALREQQIIQDVLQGGRKERIIPGQNTGYSLYIGIPFCPSVCSYCSFSSGAIDRYADRVEPYLEALCREMQQKADAMRAQGMPYPVTVYIGGGTPTSLSERQLDRVLTKAEEAFAISAGLAEGRIREYTVEAGRPDSITPEKLRIIREHGVTRISVNPQSMQPKTLERIGRKHTVQQIREAFDSARREGFDNINMDLIAGLPGETVEDVRDTLRQIRAMHPDSLTVHSLAVKRSSAIGIAHKIAGKAKATQGMTPEQKTAGTSRAAQDMTPEPAAGHADIAQMIALCAQAADDMGMQPYYLYRQKSIAGNFENTGYAVPGREGLYNILMMEEVQSIAGCGAGASSKTVTQEGQGSRIVRTENVKNIDDYIRKYEKTGGEPC